MEPEVQKLFETTTKVYQETLNSMKSIDNCLNSFSYSIQEYQTNEDFSPPGFPGTLSDSLAKLNQAMFSFQEIFHGFSRIFQNQDITSFGEICESREYQKSVLDNTLNQHLEKRHELINSVTKAKKELNDAKKSIIALSKKSKHENENLCQQWNNFRLKSYQYISEREKLIFHNNSLNEILSTYPGIVSILEKNTESQFLQKFLPKIPSHLELLAQNIEQARNELNASSSALNFPSDFLSFVEKNDFKFVDIPPPPFERYKFSSRFSAPEKEVIPRFILSFYPLFIGKILHNFESTCPDELNVSKDQRVYVLENSHGGWVLVMQMSYAIPGYVPSDFVETVGIGVAVLQKDVPSQNFYGCSGTIVSVISIGENSVECEDIDGNRTNIEKCDLILL